MKLKDVFEKSVGFFKDKKIPSARLDAEILISYALKIERLQIYLKYDQPLAEDEIENCRNVVRRRAQGEPVAYILQEKGFYGEVFSVGKGVLVPRPETEILVEESLKFIKENRIPAPRILDLGAGSGCIGFSILKNCPSASLVSVESSPEAFTYLKKNQETLELTGRSELILSSVEDSSLQEKFDLVVANPPYISEDDPEVDHHVKVFEPASALFSSGNGYNAVSSWSSKMRACLKSPGMMLFEIGYTQGLVVKKHFEGFNQFTNIKILKDLSGLDRVVYAIQ